MSARSAEIFDISHCRFSDLVDMSAFARLLDRFFHATGIPNGVVDVNGELLYLSSVENVCAVFHRTHADSEERCRTSNLDLVRDLREGSIAGGLCRNGLMDYATPVVIEGRQLATLFLGQVLHSQPDLEYFRAQATEFGFDEDAYLASIQAIPVIDKAQVDALMGVMVEMAHMLAASGLARLRQVALERDISSYVERSIHLKDILDFSPVAMGWSENEDRIEYVNRQFTQLFGYTLDDLPNLDVWYQRAYPNENYRETVVDPWRIAVAQAHQTNKQPPELEADITCKDGSMRSIIVRVAWVEQRRMVSFTDITERKHMEQALAVREQEFRSLAESSPDVVIRVDRDLRIRYLNAHMVEVLELGSAEEVIGRTSIDVWPDGRFNEIDALRKRVVTSGEMESVELAVPVPGGKIAYHHIVAVPERNTDGHIIGTIGFGHDVTAIRETERRLNSLIENLPGVAYTIRRSPQGELNFPYVSAGVEEMYGITREAAMGEFATMHGLVHPDDKVGMETAFAESARTMMPFRAEVRICPHGLPERWLDVRSDPQAQPDGSILWYGLIFDITERKRMEQALGEHEREMRSLVENLPDNIARYTTDARHTYVSPSLERLFGAPKEHFLGRTPSQCSPNPYGADVERRICAVAATGVSDELEYQFDQDGTAHYHQVRLIAERDEADRIVGVLGIGTDITERKLAGQRLEQAYAFNQHLLNAIPDPVFAKDRQHRWVLANDALCELLGKPRVELLGKSDYDFLPKEQAEVFWAMDELVFSSRQANVNEEAITDARQRLRHIQTKKTLVDDNTLIGVIRDMTESIATREMLAEAQRLARLGSWDWDVVRNRVEWSDMAYDIYTPDGRPEDPNFEDFKQSLHPDDLERVVAAVQAAFDHDTPFDLDHRVVSSSRGVRVVHARAKVFRGADGKPLRMVGTVHDVTESRQMAAALAVREREFRTLAEHLPDSVVRYDRDARFVYVNARFVALMGIGLTELRGKTPTQVPGLPLAEHFEQLVRRVAETGTEASLESELSTPNGGAFYGSIIVTPEFDNTGKIEFIQVVTRDITERRRSEQRIQTRDAMLDMVARDADLPTILNALVRYMESEDKSSLCSIMLVDAEDKHLLVGAAPSLPSFFSEAANGLSIGVGIGSSGTAAALGQRVVVEDVQTHEYWQDARQLAQDAGLRACWSEPILSSKGKVLGILAIYHAQPQSPQPKDIDLIAFVTNIAAIAIENRRVHDELERQAHSDYLTGLDNRRHFLWQAEIELARTLRYGRELSILMFDIDHFKQVNDTYGHKVGDIVLQRIAAISRSILRNIDIIGRIGGEEFAVLLPEAGLEQAKDATERLRTAFAEAQVTLESGLPLYFTASFGVTTLRDQATSLDMLLNQADQALYVAKGSGRNKVCLYQDDMVNDASTQPPGK